MLGRLERYWNPADITSTFVASQEVSLQDGKDNIIDPLDYRDKREPIRQIFHRELEKLSSPPMNDAIASNYSHNFNFHSNEVETVKLYGGYEIA